MTEVVELLASESWALLRQGDVGRLGVIVNGQPDIFPVNYLVDHGSVVFRTANGSKLTGALGHSVALEVDGYDLETGSAWSVVVKGEAHLVNQLYDVLEVMDLPLFPWDPALKPHYVRIEIDSLTGRRFAKRDPRGSARRLDPQWHAELKWFLPFLTARRADL